MCIHLTQTYRRITSVNGRVCTSKEHARTRKMSVQPRVHEGKVTFSHHQLNQSQKKNCSNQQLRPPSLKVLTGVICTKSWLDSKTLARRPVAMTTFKTSDLPGYTFQNKALFQNKSKSLKQKIHPWQLNFWKASHNSTPLWWLEPFLIPFHAFHTNSRVNCTRMYKKYSFHKQENEQIKYLQHNISRQIPIFKHTRKKSTEQNIKTLIEDVEWM